MGLGREHVQEVLDPSRPEADVALRMDAAVDGFGRGSGVDVAEVDVAEVDVAGVDVAGVDVAGRDVVGRDVVGRDVAGRDVAREVWGKWLVFVVSLDRVSRRRMGEGWRHPDVARGWR